METAPRPHWSLSGIDFYQKNRYHMCLNLVFRASPDDEFSVNIPEQIFAADGRKGGFVDFQPEWRARDGQLRFDWERPGKAAISVALSFIELGLGFDMSVTNLEGKPWENTCAFPCLNQLEAPSFEDCALERTFMPVGSSLMRLANIPRVKSSSGRPLQVYLLDGADERTLADFGCTNQVRASKGYLITESRDGKWSLGMACQSPAFLFSNQEISCIHANPSFGNVAPGERKSRSGEIRFMRGRAPALARYFDERFPA